MRLIFIFGAIIAFQGCSTTPIPTEPVDLSPEESHNLLLGTWHLKKTKSGDNGYDSQVLLSYLSNGAFNYTVEVSAPNPSLNKKSEYMGTWNTTGSTIVRNWPRIAGNPPKTTTVTIFKLNLTELVTLSEVGVYEIYTRNPSIIYR